MALSKTKQAKNARYAREQQAVAFPKLCDHHRDTAIDRFVTHGEVDRRYLPLRLIEWADQHQALVGGVGA